jgi:hypothetical protein
MKDAGPQTLRPSDLRPLTRSRAWKALLDHKKSIGRQHLRKLFTDDPKRGERMTTEDIGLFLDYSKNRITDLTLKLLIRLANQAELKNRIEAMFSGEKSMSLKTVQHCTLPCALPKDQRSWSTEKMSFRRFRKSLAGWLISQTVFVGVSGKGIPENVSAILLI